MAARNNRKADSLSEARLYSRVDVLEHTVDEIKSVLTDFAKEVREYMRTQQNAPRAIPFREIVTTMAATLAVVWGVLKFLDDRDMRAMEVHKYRIEQLERMSAH